MRLVAFVSVFMLSMLGGVAYLNPKLVRNFMLPVFFGPVSTVNTSLQWPPRVNEPYPDLELYNTSGERVRLSSFGGDLLLIEPIGMPCKACQAFSGANQVGGLDGVKPQPNLVAFHQYFRDWTGKEFTESRFRLIQIIFYGPSGYTAPTLEDAQRWSEHFSEVLPEGTTILFADSSMLSRETRAMIPSFQLVDQNFILRCDAGNSPRQDLFKDLLPLLKRAL